MSSDGAKPRLLGPAAAVSLVAFVVYVALWQATFFKSDGLFILVRLEAGTVVFNNHFLFMPVLEVLSVVLGPLGVGDRACALLLSSAGTAAGVGLAFASARWLGLPAGRSMAVAALFGITPPVLFFATVVEFHGLFMAFAQLAFFLAVRLAARPTVTGAVAVGLASALAFGFHTSSLLLPGLVLTWFLGVRMDAGHGTWRRDVGLAVVAGLVQLAGIWLLLQVLQRGFGFPEFPPAYDQGKLASTGETLPHVLDITLQEWLWPYLPVSVLATLAALRRPVRWRGVAFFCGVGVFWFLSLVLLVGRPEKGAYLVPVAMPAALLIVEACSARVAWSLVLVTAVTGVARNLQHDELGPRYRALIEGVNAASGPERPPVLLVADELEIGACLVLQPDMPRWLLTEQAKLDPASLRGHEDLLAAALGQELQRHWEAGRTVVLTAHAAAFLREKTPAGAMVLDALRMAARFEPVGDAGFDANILVPR